MDKTTKVFVIGSCSVVIAIPVIWIGSQVINGIQRSANQRQLNAAQEELNAAQEELERRAKRLVPCSNRIFREGSHLLEDQYGLEMELERNSWIEDCKRSRLPVEEVE